jgi:hypothetical protein
MAQKFTNELEHLLCDSYTLPCGGPASLLRQQVPGWQAFEFLRVAHRQDRDDLFNAPPDPVEAVDD